MAAADELRAGEPAAHRVLFVSDREADAELVRALLESSGAEPPFRFAHAHALSQAFETLERGEVDVLLMDVGEGGARELAAVSQARVRAPLVPVVVAVDSDDEALALRAVDVGARGYLVKSTISPGALTWTLHHAMRNQRMFLELNIARERARQLATYDQLTGFANRALLVDRLEQAVASARRNRHKSSSAAACARATPARGWAATSSRSCSRTSPTRTTRAASPRRCSACCASRSR
jgi:PleD family two-component response regulator